MISLATVIALASLASASPIVLNRRDGCASADGDAPFSVDCDTLAGSVTCPNGVTGSAGGVVLLVHGTGSTGSESWANGPYVQLLPSRGPKFDVCWIDLPSRSLGDAQVSAEYIAYKCVQMLGYRIELTTWP
jgi:hypothetical protein